jgi:hypothetical protein
MTVSTRRFDAGADVVYAALIDAEDYPQWLVGAKVVHIVDEEWPQPGSSFRHKVGAGPIEVKDITTVKALGPGRHFHLLVRARPFIEADVRFDVQPDGEGSVLTMNEVPVGIFRLVGPLTAPLVKARNDKSLQRLADLLDKS